MSDKLLELWESTIAASLQRNLIQPLDPTAPREEDPLVSWDQNGGPTGQPAGLADIGINQGNMTYIDAKMPVAEDPLVRASFNAILYNSDLSPNKGVSAQEQLQNINTYHKENPYLLTLLRKGLDINPDTLPSEGQTSGQYEGGSLYNQGTVQHPGNILNTFAPIASRTPGTYLNSMDIFALAQWARNIGMEFGIIQRPGDTNLQRINGVAKGAAWLASQFLLSTFNPADPQNGGLLNLLYAPTSFPASFVPGLRGNALSSPNTPAVLSVDGKVYSTTAAALPDALDRHLLMRQGLYVKQLNASDIANGTLVNYPGYIGDIAQSAPQDGLGHLKPLPGVDGLPIAAQVDQSGLLGKYARAGNYMVNMYTADAPYSEKPAVDNDYIEKQMRQFPGADPEMLIHKELFKDSGPGVPSLASPLTAVKGLLGGTKTSNYRYYFGQNQNHVASKKSSYPDFDANFPGEGGISATVQESDAIDDDNLYMPFTFQDLRDPNPQLLYFKAFLKEGLTEQFQPNWQSDGYYGRVDQVPTYTNTSRVINLAFDVVAWHPNELNIIWQKLTKLQSMVYPTYDSNNYLNAGPMIRMRIGDLFTSRTINNVKKGLPGYINSLTFSYDDGIWNIRKDYKIPRKISVALGFVVIHDGNPGLYPLGRVNFFGTLEYRDSTGNADQEGSPYMGGIRGFASTAAKPDPDQPILPTLDDL